MRECVLPSSASARWWREWWRRGLTPRACALVDDDDCDRPITGLGNAVGDIVGLTGDVAAAAASVVFVVVVVAAAAAAVGETADAELALSGTTAGRCLTGDELFDDAPAVSKIDAAVR